MKGVKEVREENKKEKLTREKIINDIKTIYFTSLKIGLLLFSITIIFASIFTLLNMETIQFLIVFTALSLLCFGMYFYHLALLKSQNFEIKSDYVKDKYDKRVNVYAIKKYGYMYERTCRLTFAKLGKYYLLHNNAKYYKWTKWGWETKQVFDSSEIGDEFYLVVTNKNRILQIYNKKLFELIDE